jgi:pyrroloquinoline quinone biosynthesis protein D
VKRDCGTSTTPEKWGAGTGAMRRPSSGRAIVTVASRPHLPRHVRLRFDPLRGKYVVLAPEKLVWPDAVSVAILKLCDGSRDVAAIAGLLAAEYGAPRGTILQDIVEFVQEWSDNLLLRL